MPLICVFIPTIRNKNGCGFTKRENLSVHSFGVLAKKKDQHPQIKGAGQCHVNFIVKMKVKIHRHPHGQSCYLTVGIGISSRIS